MLKLVAANPDAVLIAGSGTPAALPQKALQERGYKGKFYQTHGVANADFLRVCGADCNGTILPSGPILVAAQLPDSNASKAPALKYVHDVRGGVRRGLASRRSARTLYDAGLLLEQAIPVALKTAQARHAGVPRGAARRARGPEQRAGDARRLHDVADRPRRPRPARPRDGDDRERQLGAVK